MEIRLVDTLEQEFEAAVGFDEETKSELTEVEAYYCQSQVEAGFEVRFDDLKVYSRDSNSRKIITILKANLNINPKSVNDPN